MLKEYQVRELLRLCESAAGKRLDSARGNLRSKQKVPTIWELVVFDSLTGIGQVDHEPDSSGSSDIDFSVVLESGMEVWADAAWIRGRMLDDSRKINEVIDHVYQHISSRTNIPVRCISYKLIGNKTSKGHEHKMPEPQKYKEIVQSHQFTDFLKQCKDFPDQRHSCDLSPAGFSIQFEYEWREPMPIETYSGSGSMGDDPTSIADHPLYRTVKKKNEQMRKSGVSKPFIPIIGEHATGLLHDVFGRFPSTQDVLHSVYRQCSYVSGTVIVSLDSSLDGIGEGKSNLVPICSCSLNPNCKNPIEASDWDLIRALSFDRWNYTYVYWPESYTKNMKSHRDHESGSATFGAMQPDRPWSLTLPEHCFRQLLCAEKTFAELGYGDGLEACDREILDGDRPITSVEFIEGNSQQQIPDKVKVTFGPRRDRVY